MVEAAEVVLAIWVIARRESVVGLHTGDDGIQIVQGRDALRDYQTTVCKRGSGEVIE
jgi:hypothetical protein